MVFSKVNNNWNQHWECLFLVVLEYIKEVIILEEAHSSIGNLKMDTSYTLDYSFEKARNEMFNFVYLTDFEDLLKFCQEKCFLDAVGEWPVLKKSLEEWNC